MTMHPFNEEEHLKTIHYFLADAEMDILRLIDYMEYHEAKRLLGENERQLLQELSIAFRKYNDKEKKINVIIQDITTKLN